MPRQRAAGEGKPGGLLCHVARSLGFYGDGISFRLVSGQSFCLRVFPGGAGSCLAKTDSSEEDSGRLVDHVDWRLLSPFDFPEFLRLVVAC